jgi:ketosteroid isomerase-like protein
VKWGIYRQAFIGLQPINASAKHHCMELTQDSIKQIERIHSNWIQMEAAGENRHLLDLCGDDIEFWPPGSPPVVGRDAIMTWMRGGKEKIHSIEISDRHIRGSNEITYLTASYKTTLTSAKNPKGRQVRGSHLWILQNRAGSWRINLVTWSRWD